MNAAEPNTLKQQRRDSRVGGWEAQGLAEGVARYPEPLRPLPVWFTFVGCSRLPLVPERFVITEAALREAINQMVGQRTESPDCVRLWDTRAAAGTKLGVIIAVLSAGASVSGTGQV